MYFFRRYGLMCSAEVMLTVLLTKTYTMVNIKIADQGKVVFNGPKNERFRKRLLELDGWENDFLNLIG